MTFTFSPSLPVGFTDTALLISGQKSVHFSRYEYLLAEEDGRMKAFEIRYEYHRSPFKEATIVDNLLLVGHEEHFYLHDLQSLKNVLTKKMSGYFGHIYVHQNIIYVADATTLYCINNKGEITWRNTNLGIDGVVVERFTDKVVHGSGEWDPPGGWKDFVLDLKTGNLVE